MSDATPNESFLQRHSRDVVERLIRQMEEGTGPFLKRWDARVDLGLPMNPTTGKSYGAETFSTCGPCRALGTARTTGG
ncbi:DUF1738 domain-containing protein [Stenotrophomonas maltophilia]|nr:DUF1738 domain-containing protein [Stenotrophomonas maltophilia]